MRKNQGGRGNGEWGPGGGGGEDMSGHPNSSSHLESLVPRPARARTLNI